MPLEQGTLRREDILEVVRYLIELKNGNGQIDDIDHLGNRRVRAVGELVENQYRIGLVRMERAIKERMSLQDIETLMPQELINYKPVSAVIKEFFGSSQLSQFMDQTNPLSEITHKRRLSALGPGGLTRERAGFEVRDVHPTHYGRVCPIETPEGPNIGLIASLSTYARVNDYGFVETPYREVEKGRVTERDPLPLGARGRRPRRSRRRTRRSMPRATFTADLVSARKGGEFMQVPPEQVEFMDVSPNQLVSVAASLIPFLENDDANRALMGSNMQRQAVPLLRTDAPLVGTGMERVVARDSGVTVVARARRRRRDRRRRPASSSRPTSRAPTAATPGVDIYNLVKYQRSNQNTCINQRPIVVVGDRVQGRRRHRRRPVDGDGRAGARPQRRSSRSCPGAGTTSRTRSSSASASCSEDYFTSIHIEEFECVARDTKLGPEEITRDIPNVGDEALKDLDESGIIRIGAEVKPRRHPRRQDHARRARPSSRRKRSCCAPSSARRPARCATPRCAFRRASRARSSTRASSRARASPRTSAAALIEEDEVARLTKDQHDEVRIIKRVDPARRSRSCWSARPPASASPTTAAQVLLPKGAEITAEDLDQIPSTYWGDIKIDDEQGRGRAVARRRRACRSRSSASRTTFQEKIERLKGGDELPPGVIKMVKVFVAIKRKLQVGDKMAGRHGNKGVLSRILPEEDMPYLADGTPVDIVLNPLGVPSRMNVGQILETHLGWAARELGRQLAARARGERRGAASRACASKLKEIYVSKEIVDLIDELSDEDVAKIVRKAGRGIHVASPVFDGATEDEIFGMLKRAGLSPSGQMPLADGRTGEPFEQPVTVGVMYMMKLHHLVDDKIHARSTGPYSLVTQQPLGGKAQFGGQRLGEMEVWALEAYGAAYSLQEMLTVKSDDVAGRTRMYEAIVKGENVLEPGLPESFNVMVKELQSLALDVELDRGAEPGRPRARAETSTW